jgi:hypothetical protein
VTGGLVLLLVVAVVGDVTARAYAQGQMEKRIDSRVPGATSQVHISSFPFVGKLLLAGKVDDISAHISHVSYGQFNFDSITLRVNGLEMDRNLLLRRQVRVTGIRTATVSADMNQADFDRLVGYPVVLGDGQVEVSALGVTASAKVSVVNNELRLDDLRAGGFSLGLTVPIRNVIPFPRLAVLPCVAGVKVIPGHLVTTCTFHTVPDVLKRQSIG